MTRHFTPGLAATVLVAACCLHAAPAFADDDAANEPVIDGKLIDQQPIAENAVEQPSIVDEWIVVLSDNRPERRRGWSSGVAYSGSYNYADDPRLVRLARSIASDYSVTVTQQWPVRSLSVHCVVVRIEQNLESTLAALRDDKRVRWVQPLNTFEGLGKGQAATADKAADGDPYRHLQASLEVLNVAPLHRRWSGEGVRIAIVDSGVEADHPDLEHALAEQLDFVGSGRHSERHGTGIAGVLVAADHNGIGIRGIAPGAHLHAYRACWELADGRTECNSLTLSLALDRIVDARPNIVNLSLTGPRDRLLDRLVARIVEQGAIVVVAHDSKSSGDNRFPTPGPGIVVVRDGSGVSTTADDFLYAPGDAVLTAQPGHSYDYMTGASIAAAHVTGVLALILEANPRAVPAETMRTLAGSVRSGEAGSSIDACVAAGALADVGGCRIDAGNFEGR